MNIQRRVGLARAALHYLECDLRRAAIKERAHSKFQPPHEDAEEDRPAWKLLEAAADATAALQSELISTRTCVDSAVLRDWKDDQGPPDSGEPE